MKKNAISRVLFKVVDGALVYSGWFIQGDGIYGEHVYKETPQGISFGKTGILLRLIDGWPKLYVPEGQKAELLLHDHFSCKEECFEGRLVEVRIY